MLKVLSINFIAAAFCVQVQASHPNHLPGLINDSKVDSIICSPDNTIQSNMAQLGFMIRNLTEMVTDFISNDNSDDLKAVLMVDIQVLRVHLIAVLPKTPEKILKIDSKNVQKNKLLYQSYLLKMIQISIDIESELLRETKSLKDEEAQRIKISSLILAIEETVNKAHSLFRY